MTVKRLHFMGTSAWFEADVPADFPQKNPVKFGQKSTPRQGAEVIRDAMLDLWEAELGADFTPKAPWVDILGQQP